MRKGFLLPRKAASKGATHPHKIAEVTSAPEENAVEEPASEILVLKVMSIMKEAYGALPQAFWNLSHAADLLAPRGFVVDDDASLITYRRRSKIGKEPHPYPIASIKIEWWFLRNSLVVIPGVKSVIIATRDFKSEVHLCEGVEEVEFDPKSRFNRHLDLPAGLKSISFGRKFDKPVIFPSGLKRIFFPEKSAFDQPITVPGSIEEIRLGDAFSQDIDLRACSRLRSVQFGDSFDRQVHLPESVEELIFGERFNQKISHLPQNLRVLIFGLHFNQEVSIPPRVEILFFHPDGHFDQTLVLQETNT